MVDYEARPYVFLSYSREDAGLASDLRQQLSSQGLNVWQDQDIPGGARWRELIDARVRAARAVVVLLSEASAQSDWVTYEYALATGAYVPVVAVALPGVAVPKPIGDFQVVTYTTSGDVPARIGAGIEAQERALRERTSPTIMARFMEYGGKPIRYKAQPPALRIELWLEQVPAQTRTVNFEIPDREIEDRQWGVSRPENAGEEMREFLSTGILLNRNVEIWARGIGSERGSWSAKSTIHDALKRYYADRRINADVQSALEQFSRI